MEQLLRYGALIVDGLGYGKLSPEEVDLLFQLPAERYECGSLLICGHLTFSKWEQIFQNSMMTTAVIDRLVITVSSSNSTCPVIDSKSHAKAERMNGKIQ